MIKRIQKIVTIGLASAVMLSAVASVAEAKSIGGRMMPSHEVYGHHRRYHTPMMHHRPMMHHHRMHRHGM